MENKKKMTVNQYMGILLAGVISILVLNKIFYFVDTGKGQYDLIWVLVFAGINSLILITLFNQPGKIYFMKCLLIWIGGVLTAFFCKTRFDMVGEIICSFSILMYNRHFPQKRKNLLIMIILTIGVLLAIRIYLFSSCKYDFFDIIESCMILLFYFILNILFFGFTSDDMEKYIFEKESIVNKLDEEKTYTLIGKNLLGIFHNDFRFLFHVPIWVDLAKRHMENKNTKKAIEILDKLEETSKKGEKNIELLAQLLKTKYRYERKVININTLLTDCINYFKLYVDNFKSISLNTHLCDAPVIMSGISFEILQSFENILYNAFDAIKNKPKKEIYIQTSIDNSDIVIIFFDNGDGIKLPGIEWNSFQQLKSESDMDTSFEAIYKVPPDIFKIGVSSKKNGTGLGMSRLIYYVRNNNGEIEIYTNSQGTMIVLTFPYSQNELRQDEIDE